MRILLVTLRTRPGTEDISRRERIVETERPTIGRGIANAVVLPDLDVDQHHASLISQGEDLVMVATVEGGLMADNRPRTELPLRPGVTCRIGRWQFRAEAGRDGADHVLVMEEAPPEVVKKPRDPRDLHRVLPSRRLLAWVLAAAVIGVFVAWPVSQLVSRPVPPADAVDVVQMVRAEPPKAGPMEIAWTSGPMSKAHDLVGEDCSACHQRPFERVADAACLTCHATTTHHADPADFPSAGLTGTRCATCHVEHEGGTAPRLSAAADCVACHGRIEQKAPGTRLPPIADFGRIHPRFRPETIQMVVVDPVRGALNYVRMRAVLGDKPELTERSGLVFPHDKHLRADGLNAPTGRRVLDCADCHKPDPGGALMTPVTYETACAACHKLEFDAGGTVRELPHAKEDEVARILSDYFRARAFEGGLELESAPAPLRRGRLPGQSLADEDRTKGLEWAVAETERQLDGVFGRRLCGVCHQAEKFADREPTERWRVYPALIQRQWMPKAHFSHAPHKGMDCAGCHAARESKTAADVLMPAIETCRSCHGTGGASGSASAECTDCHSYHLPGRPPMSPPHADMADRLGKAGAGGAAQ